MRLLHTSDWHLGHVLHDRSREFEHARFLAWLLDTIGTERIDALVLAGDVFDVANPSTAALDAFYGFVGAARRRFSRLSIVVIGGNHDSPSRLDVTNPLLDRLGVHVVGGLPRRADRSLDVERLVVALRDATGAVAAHCVAVPYLRPSDLPVIDGMGPGVDPLIEGVRRVYSEAIDAARTRRTAGQAIVATGHAYMTGAKISELSERKILGGNLHALPVDIFPSDVTYAALGHLHLAQKVGGRDNVRYSGSPIPLSFSELDYQHQVLVIEIDGGQARSVRTVTIPRSVELLRIPADRARPLAEVVALLRALPTMDGPEDDPTRPLLEVRVLCDRPEPNLRREVEAAASGKNPRILRIALETTGDGRALADGSTGASLRDVNRDDVFLRCYASAHGSEPSPELRAAFADLCESVDRGDSTP